MKIPVVLPTVHVTVDTTGCLSVAVDGDPYRTDRYLRREDLAQILDEITTGLQTAVRVEVAEGDGTTYSDIAAPSPDADGGPAVSMPTPPMPGLQGKDFTPGEKIAVAYVLMHRTADSTGRAVLHLPPALLTRRKSALVLVGLTSGMMTCVEEPA